jgi:mannose-6-phosphate isomerase-like protein (cupin superfamily)
LIVRVNQFLSDSPRAAARDLAARITSGGSSIVVRTEACSHRWTPSFDLGYSSAMLSLVALVVSLSLAESQAPPMPAVHISKEDHEKTLKESIANNVVDQPIKATDVPGGKASVAMLHREKAEASALIHDHVTETYYILSGSGTITTGGKLGDAKPTDLTRLNAGMSQTGTRIGGESRKVKPGDIVIIPAGTPHSFSQLDAPISYLVYRFEPK